MINVLRVVVFFASFIAVGLCSYNLGRIDGYTEGRVEGYAKGMDDCRRIHKAFEHVRKAGEEHG